MANIDNIKIRMYRVGTGDFFLLQFNKGKKTSLNFMIDCGCISSGQGDFDDSIDNLHQETGGVIDILVVTHEHDDHINGFQKSVSKFDKLTIKEVWFAWTEEDEDYANEFRKEHTKLALAISEAVTKLNSLVKNGKIEDTFKDEYNGKLMLEGRKTFINTLGELDALNVKSKKKKKTGPIPTMEDKLREWKVIKPSTKVKFYSPGKVIENLQNAEGLRFFVLGPPKNNDYIKLEEKHGEGYEKREKPSSVNLAFINVFDETESSQTQPFDEQYTMKGQNELAKDYKSKANHWRNIDSDWLLSAGSLALRHERSINNTSLALAIQFTGSEKVLLFPGDAEHGNWLSWHDNLEWKFKEGGKTKKVNAEYILNNTVFYKAGHHLSNNGTLKGKGLDLMSNDEFAAMVTLGFNKVNKGWLNTMPNDIIGAELIRKSGGKVFFLGEWKKILDNIKTDRVSISKANSQAVEKNNKKFDDEIFVDYTVNA